MTRRKGQFHFRTVSPDDGAVSWKEYRGCKSKTYHATEPECSDGMYAYSCEYCGGWHKATRRDARGGIPKPQNGWCNGLEYRDGYPIVPDCTGKT